MLDPDALITLAHHILNTVVETYGQYGVALPSRQFLSVGGQGGTVHDCEQVSVSFEQGYSGAPGAQSQTIQKCDGVQTAVFYVEVVRCIPTTNDGAQQQSRYGQELSVDAPTPQQLTAVAETQMRDARVMLDAGMSSGINTLLEGALVDIAPGPASGGFQAMGMTVTLALPDPDML